jgi:hypothetical protein
MELTQEEFDAKLSMFKENLELCFSEGIALQKEIMEQLKKVKYDI